MDDYVTVARTVGTEKTYFPHRSWRDARRFVNTVVDAREFSSTLVERSGDRAVLRKNDSGEEITFEITAGRPPELIAQMKAGDTDPSTDQADGPDRQPPMPS